MNKTILRLAIPNIISNISIPLLSAVDTMLMGNLEDEKYLGAIALGSTILNFVYWGLGFLRMGTTGLTAQAFGQKDKAQMSLLLGQALLVATIASVLLLLLQWPIGEMSLYLMGGSEAVQGLAGEYFYIRIWAAPAALGILVFNGWFLGMQNAKYPMIITIVVNIANVVFNLFFVKYLDMTSAGVAYGTLIAQYLGFGMALFILFRQYKSHLQALQKKALFQIEGFARFFKVNRDIFIRTMCLVFTFTYFTAASAQAGDTILAANQILMLFLMIVSYAVDGFAYASESLVGRFVGAKQTTQLRESIKYCFIWGMAFALLFSLFYAFFGDWLLQQFTQNEPVLTVAREYLFWLILLPVLAAGAFIWDGIYIGATASVAMRNSMILATFACFFPAYFLLEPYFGNHALWFAMILYMTSRTILLSLLASKHILNINSKKV